MEKKKANAKSKAKKSASGVGKKVKEFFGQPDALGEVNIQVEKLAVKLEASMHPQIRPQLIAELAACGSDAAGIACKLRALRKAL